MKHRLTIQYFLWITGFMFFCYLLNTTFDFVNDHYPIPWIRQGPVGELRESTVNLLMNLLMLPFVLLVAWLVARRMLSPLRRIADSADRISAGRLKERLSYPHPGDELGRMVVTLNKAFDEYGANLERQKRFSANVAHQLRTPLAAMRGAGEICLTHPRAVEHYQETIASMLERIERLSRICEQLLELSRLDTPSMRARLGAIDPAGVIQEAGKEYAPVAQSRGVELRFDLQAGIQIDGIPDLIAEVVSNLSDNAIRHAPVHGVVMIRWRLSDGNQPELLVEDNGPGIPESMRESLFEPFHREAQSRDTGSGLGLALVAEIARLHGASVLVGTSPLGGALLGVVFPAKTHPGS